MHSNENTAGFPANLFHPVEHAILAKFFGAAAPAFSRRIDIQSNDETACDPDSAGIVRLRSDLLHKCLFLAVESAVARLVLRELPFRIPSRHDGGQRLQENSLSPQYLLGTEWRDAPSTATFSEIYRLAFVPGYEKYVVTASKKGPGSSGSKDTAIGCFCGQTPARHGCRLVISTWWQEKFPEEPARLHQIFRDDGMIDAPTARRWADGVSQAKHNNVRSLCG